MTSGSPSSATRSSTSDSSNRRRTSRSVVRKTRTRPAYGPTNATNHLRPATRCGREKERETGTGDHDGWRRLGGADGRDGTGGTGVGGRHRGAGAGGGRRGVPRRAAAA